MRDPHLIDELTQRVGEAMPGGLGALGEDLRRALRAALESALARMDLVTREEFDVQTAVLARTRQKLADLEREVAALEAQQDDDR